MLSKLDIIALRVKSILEKTAIRRRGDDALDVMADKLDQLLEQIPFALREKVLKKINKLGH
jgi:hypothetical protein